MSYEPIIKGNVKEFSVKPNLLNYEEARESFSWDDIYKELDGLEGGGLNIAYEAIDRHAKTSLREKVALYWEGKDGNSEQYTFHDLYILTNRFANILQSLGIKKGDRVFTYTDRTPEIFVAILGTLKAGAVVGPLFSAFGPDAVKDRLQDSGARVLITTPGLVTTVHEIAGELPAN